MRRAWLPLVLGLAAPGFVVLEAASLDDLNACRQRVAELDAQLDAERAVYEAELTRGVIVGLWTDENAAASMDWVKTAYEAPMSSVPPVPRGPDPADRWGRVLARFSMAARPESRTGPVDFWFSSRLEALWRARVAAKEQWHRTAVDYAEDVWLRARNAVDLQPAVAALAEIKTGERRWTLLSMTWRNSVQALAGRWSNRDESIPDLVLHAFHLWTVLSPGAPLLLPDPAVDPAAGLRAWDEWSALRRAGHTSVSRPRMTAKFHDFQERLFGEARIARETLHELIVGDAAPSDFEAALKRAEIFSPPAHVPSRPPIPPASASSFGRPVDYHDLIGDPRARGPGRPRELSVLVPAAYFQWLAWRRAVESGDIKSLESARVALLKSIGDLPLPAVIPLGQRLASRREVAPPPLWAANPEPGSAAEQLARVLAVVARAEGRPENQTILLLAQVWSEAADRAEIPVTAGAKQLGTAWRAVSAERGSVALFALRDAAAKELLHRIAGEASPPAKGALLSAALDAALEKQLSEHAWSKATQVLSLARLSGSWSDSQINEHARLVGWLETAAAAPELTSPAEVRAACQQILRTSQSPAAVAFAAARMRELLSSHPSRP